MFEDKCVWSALYPISNHSHIRQLQFATHAFSQQVLQQAVQISICQCSRVINCRNYSSYDPQLMKEYFKTVDWRPVFNANDVNIALDYFNDVVKGIFDRHAPYITKGLFI